MHTFTEAATIVVGSTPNYITFEDDSNLAFVSNYGNSADISMSSIGVFNTTSFALQETLRDSTYIQRPTTVTYDRDHHMIYISNLDGFISFFNTKDWKFLPLKVEISMPRDVLLCTKQNKLYIVNFEKNGELIVLDTNELKIKTRINVGSYPISVTTDSCDNIYVVNHNGGVSVVSSSTDKVIATIETPQKSLLFNMVIDSKDQLGYISAGSVLGNQASILKVMLKKNVVIKEIKGLGMSPHSLEISEDFKKLYIASSLEASVRVLDVKSGNVTAKDTIEGCQLIGQPFMNKDNLYVTCASGNSIVVLQNK